MIEDTLPSGWQEAGDTEHDAGQYNPQPISRFEHTETGVGVRLTPVGSSTATNTGNGDGSDEREGRGEYQVTVGEDGSGDPSDMALLTDASDHAGALGDAREFMETYNERCIEGNEDVESVLADHGQ